MCGIAGILSKRAVDEQAVGRLIAPIAHRGPDDSGVWVDSAAGVGLGFRRLAIVDLSPAGRQPMHSADGRFVLTFNGEIYNHRELRGALEQAGAAPDGGWRGHSDTEVFLQAIGEWGLEAALARTAGMFAFALWDRRERRLHLVRDRFGEKPLYYGWVGGDFLFGSELKAIRAHPGFDNPIDHEASHLFLRRGYIPAPLTIYRRIYKLEPGCILTLTAEAAATPLEDTPDEGRAGSIALSRYWSYRDVVRAGLDRPIGDEAEALDALEAALTTAIRGQSVADVPVGAFLSGGIDSSTVVALYQKHSPSPARTFSIGFEEAAFDEAGHARKVAAHLGTVHNEHVVTAREALEVIPLLPAMYDEPFADSSQIPTFLVSRFARSQVTVALTGDGGDELFGGYNRHVALPLLWQRASRLPRAVRSAAAAVLGVIPHGLWAAAASGERHPEFAGKLRKAIQVAATARSFDDVCAKFLDDSLFVPPAIAVETGRMELGAAAPDAVRLMYCDAMTYLPDDVLAKVDRASMAVSLETRVPFLDHRVAEVAARIPLAMKVHGGAGKQILRKLLHREVPPELVDRPKAGFAVPVGEWIRGPLRDWAEDLLDPAAMADGWLDAAMVQQRWREHLSGRQDSSSALWSVLMFQAWLREQGQAASIAA